MQLELIKGRANLDIGQNPRIVFDRRDEHVKKNLFILYMAASGENQHFWPIPMFGVEVKKPLLRGNLNYSHSYAKTGRSHPSP